MTYTADLPLPIDVNSGMGHLWTLAVEEQFYLFWPFLLLLAVRNGRLPQLLLASLVVLGLIGLALVAVFHAEVGKLYKLPTTWAPTLVVGAMAYAWRPTLDRLLSGRRGAVAAAIWAALLLAMGLVPDAKDHAWTYLVGGHLVAACTVALIRHVSRWDGVPVPALEVLRLLGVVSYGAYLWNYFIVQWVRGGDGRESWPEWLATIPLTVLFAAASWHLVERRALALKDSATPLVAASR